MLAGSLEIELFADVARLRADMNNALGIVQRTARGFDDAAAQMRNALGGIGGGLSAAAFGTWIKSAIDFQDQLNDLNKTTDIAVSKLAGISLMSKQTGSDLTGMAQAMNKLTLEMGKAPEKFAKIGITAKDPLEAFKQLSEIFRSIEDPQLRAAVAAEALGKGWASAAPALSEGSKAIGDMVTRGEELAGITALDAQMADAFNDSMSELQLALMGTASNLAGDMLPLLTELVKSLTDVTASANNTETPFNVLTETLRALIVIGGNVAFVIHGIAVEIGGMAAQAAAFFSGNLSQAKQIGEDMAADAARRRAAFDGWEKSMMTAGTAASSLGNETDALSRRMAANAKATLSAADAARLKAFVDAAAAKKGASDSAAAAKKAASEIQKLREQELKFLMDWGRADVIRQGEAVIESNKEYAESLAKVAEEYADLVEAQDKATTSLASEVRAQREYNQRIGLTTDAIAALDAAKLQEQATAKDRLATLADEVDWTGQLGDAYRTQAQSLRDLAQLKSDGAFSQKQIDDFKSVFESVDRTAHDTFVNIFESGQNAFEKLSDTLKSTLLDLLYQMTIRKWVFNVTASVTGAGGNAVSAVGAASGLMGNSGGLLGTIQGGADILNTGGIAGLGNTLGFGAGSSMFTQFATSGIGNALGLSTAVDAIGGVGTASTALTGAGSAFAAAMPWIGGALAIASLLGGGKRGGPKDTGSFGSGFLGDVFTRTDTQPEFNSGAAGIVSGISGSYGAAAKSLGINAGAIDSGAFYAIDNKGEGDALTQLRAATYLNGKLVYDRNNATQGGNFEDVGRSPEELQAAITLASARAVLSALKASDLPAQLQSYFDALDPLAMSAEQITAALDLAKAAQQFTKQIGFMGAGLSNLAGLSVKATAELAAAAGGMEALQSKFAAYYQAFYSEEERAAASLASVTDAMTGLGYSSVDTISEFRDLVESINPVDDASRELLATLLDIAPAFAAAHAEGENFVENLLDGMSAAASKYFAGVDAAAMADDLFGDAASGIDKFLGTTVKSVADAQMEQAQAAISAARDAANLWGNAKSSIESALKDVRDLGNLISPSASRSKSLSQLDRATMAALGGDATAAASVGELAKSFLSASKSSSVDRLDYLRDRAMAEAKMVSVLDKAKSQITLQESIANASEAMVGQLQTINQSLTGFGAQVYELLTKGYLGADRGTANDAAGKLAKATSDFAYFFNTAKEGDVVTGGQWGSSKVTRLAGDMASFTDSSGVVSYLRAADTIIGLGKQSPELRAIWEQQYGFKLPSYAVGTPFVPQDMIAQIHKGEAIMPAPVAQRWRDTGGGDSALMQDLLMETKAIRKNSDKTENRIYKLERIVDDWDRNGVPTINQPDTVLEVTP